MDGFEALVAAGRAGRLAALAGRDAPGGDNALAQSAPPKNAPRFQVTNFVNNRLAAEASLAPLYAALAGLPLQFWLAPAYGPALPAALAAAGRPANVHAVEGDWPGRTLRRPDLIRLRGDVARPHTLVVRPADYETAWAGERLGLYNRARDWLSGHVVLIAGSDPRPGSDFREFLFPHLLQGGAAFSRGAFLLWPGPAGDDVAFWAARGITVVDAEPLAFVERLAVALAGVRPVDPELAHFAGLARLMGGAGSPDELEDQVAQVPAAERPKSIRLTLTLDLDENNELLAALDIRYFPDQGLDYDPKRLLATGVALERLNEWAAAAATLRNNGLPPDEAEATALLDAILATWPAHLKEYQTALLLARLFPATVTVVISLAEGQGRLWPAPWELLHDGHVAGLRPNTGGRGFLALNYPTYRWLPAATSGAQVSGPLRKALLVAADPRQTLAGLASEVERVAEKLAAGGWTIDRRPPDGDDAADAERVKQLVQLGDYDLFHFAGHGLFDPFDPPQSGLILGRPGGEQQLLPVAALAQAAGSGRLKLVIFSACAVGQAGQPEPERPWLEVGVVTALLRAGAPAALAMQWNVEDEAGRLLVETLYEKLVEGGQSLEMALLLARQRLAALELADWANPVLARKHG
jgi:hypothetical protein